VVSAYVGETERNLARVFARAEERGAVLLLDEADALFGERTDVRDAHDRYADKAIAYLLQRIESHPGIVVLAVTEAPRLRRRQGRSRTGAARVSLSRGSTRTPPRRSPLPTRDPRPCPPVYGEGEPLHRKE
jgi:hypothetical protein